MSKRGIGKQGCRRLNPNRWMQIFRRLLPVGCLFAMILAAHSWSSKDLPLFEPIHQMAIDNVLKTNVSSVNLQILKNQQVAVDQDQAAAQSFEHSMTGLEKGHDANIEKTNYIAKAEVFIRTNLMNAIQARKAGSSSLAFTNLGIALHPLEDATSPAHEKFQVWSYNEGIWAKARHVMKERSYPSPKTEGDFRARLEGSVRYAYDIFTEKIAMPPHFFDLEGKLDLPTNYLHTATP